MLNLTKPIFATYVMTFEQDKFIMRNLENSYPHVDHIYVMYSKYPWNYNPDAREIYPNTFDLNLIKNSPYMDKITIIEGQWDTDTDQRNACLSTAKEDGVDYLMVHDADEYYFHKDFEQLVQFIKESPNYDVFEIMVKVFWKSFDNIIINHDGSEVSGLNQTIVNLNRIDHYDHIRDVYTMNKITVEGIYCYHGSYVLTNEEVYKKINTWSHNKDFNTEKWYNEVWLRWTEESRNLHPIWPWAWMKAQKYTGNLPEVLNNFKYE